MASDYKDNDDLGLYLSLIESVEITFNPQRKISFKIIKPFDHTESTLRYTYANLTFKNVMYSDVQLVNEFHEYPEFYRSAILQESDLLHQITQKLERLNKKKDLILKEYYFYLDLGNSEKELRVICESHELTILSEPKLLEEFQGLDE